MYRLHGGAGGKEMMIHQAEIVKNTFGRIPGSAEQGKIASLVRTTLESAATHTTVRGRESYGFC